MPRRNRTRAQNRAQAINDERHHNQQALQAEAEELARQQRKHPGNTREETHFASTPRSAGDPDPPPF
jgi:hypothetical protein